MIKFVEDTLTLVSTVLITGMSHILLTTYILIGIGFMNQHNYTQNDFADNWYESTFEFLGWPYWVGQMIANNGA